VFLRDFTFIDVGNPNYVKDKEKMINITKLTMMANVARDFERYQSVEYDLDEDVLAVSQQIGSLALLDFDSSLVDTNHSNTSTDEILATVSAKITDEKLYHFSNLCESSVTDV